jgi:tRNA nucleotidyltransferase (CCA-adding enzyme)
MLATVVPMARRREDGPVRAPDRLELLKRIGDLPAGRPLLAALNSQPGVYLVGGAVRDVLLGGAPSDLDLVVEGDPVAVAARIGPNPVVYDRFGTTTVASAGFSYDIGAARRETYAEPGALPAVSPAGLQEDLQRRDFTVNAIAVALDGPRPGELIAYPGGLDDLEQRTLRILHDQSFLDDPTRLLRLARYQARLGFSIDPHTRELAGQAVGGGALDAVSGARIGNELRLLAREQDPVAALLALRELELDRAIHPRFGLTDAELARRGLALLPLDGRRDRLVLAAAALTIPAGELRGLLDRLDFEAADRDAILAAVRVAPDLSRALTAARRASEIAEAVGQAGPEAVALAGALGAEDPAQEWLERLRLIRLEIDGRDLIAAGVPEGPALGRGLKAALAAKLDGRARGREDELRVALESLEDSG